MKIRFSWPDSRFFPNRKQQHRYLTAERWAARMSGYALTINARLTVPENGALEWRLVLCPPDKRRRDDDNVYAAFKPTRDGIFAALETDDSRLRRTVIEWGEAEEGGAIYVEIAPLADLHLNCKVTPAQFHYVKDKDDE